MSKVRNIGLFNHISDSMAKRRWKSGIDEELSFWRNWIETDGGQWPEQLTFRLDPSAELQPYIVKYLGAPRPISILDAGSGPLTVVGKQWESHPVNITACDALAEHYRDLPVTPLVPVKAIESEKIDRYFSPNFFDVTHARNTLDHSYNPIRAIRALISVTKPGGLIILLHAACEATKENFQGFHQWDFYISNDRFCIRSRKMEIDVYEAVGQYIDILEVIGNNGKCWIYARKQ